jgi:hypothetical protein
VRHRVRAAQARARVCACVCVCLECRRVAAQPVVRQHDVVPAGGAVRVVCTLSQVQGAHEQCVCACVIVCGARNTGPRATGWAARWARATWTWVYTMPAETRSGGGRRVLGSAAAAHPHDRSPLAAWPRHQWRGACGPNAMLRPPHARRCRRTGARAAWTWWWPQSRLVRERACAAGRLAGLGMRQLTQCARVCVCVCVCVCTSPVCACVRVRCTPAGMGIDRADVRCVRAGGVCRAACAACMPRRRAPGPTSARCCHGRRRRGAAGGWCTGTCRPAWRGFTRSRGARGATGSPASR